MEQDNLTGVQLIAAERLRQITQEGWSPEHDREHVYDQLAYAAICYADPHKRMVKIPEGVEEKKWPTVVQNGVEYAIMPPSLWPWGNEEWKPTPDDRVRELTKAGALIAAEIDRLLNTGEA